MTQIQNCCFVINFKKFVNYKIFGLLYVPYTELGSYLDFFFSFLQSPLCKVCTIINLNLHLKSGVQRCQMSYPELRVEGGMSLDWNSTKICLVLKL